VTNKDRILALALGLVLALLSSAKAGKAWAIYGDIDGCVDGCEVAAAGWPLPYLVDYPGLSVGGSVDLVGAILGQNHLRPLLFSITLLFWTLAAVAGLVLLRRLAAKSRK
jgi:hypothetical protein